MAGSKLYLTRRDMSILRAIGQVPFISGPELGALFFDETDTPRSNRIRRLAQLRMHALLLSPPRAGSRAPHLYALTPIGAAMFLSKSDTPVSEILAFSTESIPASLYHFSLLAHTFVRLTLALRKKHTLTLDRFYGESYFKHSDNFDRLRTPSGKYLPVLPDGLFILRRHVDGKRKFIFIEADTGTENLGRIARKIRAYEAYRSPAGQRAFEARFHAPPHFAVLFVTPGRRRVENLRRTVAASASLSRLSLYRFATPNMLLHPLDAAGQQQFLFD